MGHKLKPCQMCGGPKQHGIPNSPYCGDCRAARMQCKLCGGPKMTIQRRVCDQCNLLGRVGGPKVAATESVTPEGRKWCNRCETYLPLKNFNARNSKAGVAPYCRPCESLYSWGRNVTKFGISPDDYFAILKAQGGGCAICATRPRTKRLAVDHNHQTGEVRGLLCTLCNHRVLGGAKERVDILLKAAAYLENPPARAVLVAGSSVSASAQSGQ